MDPVKPIPELDPELQQVEERIRSLHERIQEFKENRQLMSAPAETLEEIQQRVETIWSYFVSIERIREQRLCRLNSKLDEIARLQPRRVLPPVPLVEPDKVPKARSRRWPRPLRWPTLAFLVVFNILMNIYVIIWEQRHETKIFPGT